MSEIPNFSEQIIAEQRDRISNLKTGSEGLGQDFVSFRNAYFLEHPINPDTIRSFIVQALQLRGENVNVNITEGMMTLLKLPEGSVVVEAVLEKGPFNSAEELVESISQHIQESMSYDPMAFLVQAGEIGDIIFGQQTLSSEELDKSIDVLSRVLRETTNTDLELTGERIRRIRQDNQGGENEIPHMVVPGIITEALFQTSGVNFKAVHLQYFQEALNIARTMMKEDFFDPHWERIIVDMQIVIDSGDIHNLSEYIMENMNSIDFSNFIWLIVGEAMEDFSISSNNIDEVMYEIQTGVCRHYSMIAREVYNEIIRKNNIQALPQIQFSGNSKVLYVSNDPLNHAYNVLLTQGLDGELKQQYFDITSLVTGSELWQDMESIPNRELEVWAQLNSLDNRTYTKERSNA